MQGTETECPDIPATSSCIARSLLAIRLQRVFPFAVCKLWYIHVAWANFMCPGDHVWSATGCGAGTGLATPAGSVRCVLRPAPPSYTTISVSLLLRIRVTPY
jgi:hypothetical protein